MAKIKKEILVHYSSDLTSIFDEFEQFNRPIDPDDLSRLDNVEIYIKNPNREARLLNSNSDYFSRFNGYVEDSFDKTIGLLPGLHETNELISNEALELLKQQIQLLQQSTQTELGLTLPKATDFLDSTMEPKESNNTVQTIEVAKTTLSRSEQREIRKKEREARYADSHKSLERDLPTAIPSFGSTGLGIFKLERLPANNAPSLQTDESTFQPLLNM